VTVLSDPNDLQLVLHNVKLYNKFTTL